MPLNTIADPLDSTVAAEKVKLIRRGKKGLYTAEFHHNGQHRRRALKTVNRKVAQQKVIELEASLLAGHYLAPPKPKMVQEAAKEYIDGKEADGRAKKTILAYRQELKVWTEFLAGRAIRTLIQITAKDFEDYKAERKKVLADKTRYTRLIIIKGFMKWCTTVRTYLNRNPIAGIPVSKPYTSPKFTPAPQQVQMILQKAVGELQIQYALLAFTGLRVGEMKMLRPQDVDLAGGWIHVVGRPGWVPKTREARKIPIHPDLMPYLQKVAPGKRAYFFAATSAKHPHGQPINERLLLTEFQDLATSLGMPIKHENNGFVIHSLRHFFETAAVNSAVPQVVVDLWMGHRGGGTMSSIYYGLSDQQSQEFMKQVKF